MEALKIVFNTNIMVVSILLASILITFIFIASKWLHLNGIKSLSQCIVIQSVLHSIAV